jgi:hypothetical protein
MGRSVSVLSRADEVTYFDISNMGMDSQRYDEETGDWVEIEDESDYEFNDTQFQMDWDDFVEGLIEGATGRYKSLNKVDKWEHNEDHIILENNFAEIAISQYGGLVSLAIRHKEDEDAYWYGGKNKTGLAQRWVAKSWPGIRRAIAEAVGYPELYSQGHMSNGEGVFGYVDKKEAA